MDDKGRTRREVKLFTRVTDNVLGIYSVRQRTPPEFSVSHTGLCGARTESVNQGRVAYC